MDGLFAVREADVPVVSDAAESAGRRNKGNHAVENGIVDYIAAGQIALLAGVVLYDVFLRHKANPLVAEFAFNLLVVCGFAIQAIFWAKRKTLPTGFLALGKEAMRRALQAAGLVLLVAIVSTHVSGAPWETFDPQGMFLLLAVLASAGVFVASICHRFVASSSPQRIMVFGPDSAFLLAKQLRVNLSGTDVCFYPTSQLPSSKDVASGTSAPFFADPRLVEFAPDVAVLTGCDGETLNRLSGLLAPLPIDVLIHVPANGSTVSGSVVTIANRQFIRMFPKPLSLGCQALKRAFDIVTSLALVIFVLPLLLVVALLIKVTSPGPVLFRQTRVGLKGSHFTVFKFRTMRADAVDPRADSPTVRNDPRVTQVGAFLRKSSIDELPQLFNVLLGSMSLVGPRPHAMNGEAFGAIVGNYHARHRVKPGITGLAQILGWRGLANTPQKVEQRVANDLRYISDWSFARDILIIFRTAFVVCGKNVF